MPFLDLPAARLSYLDRGDGPAVVLVHGWSLASGALAPLADALGGGVRVIAPDLRGHGASAAGREGAGGAPRNEARFGLPDLAADLAALLERLELRRVLLAGWSLGAQVALAALPAVRERVAGLALLSGTPRFTAGPGWEGGLPAQAVEVLAHRVRRDPARALARFFDGMFAEGELTGDAAARIAALRAALPAPDPAAALAGLAVLAETDLRDALAAVDAPTLVLHGDRDPICPPAAGRALATAIRSARLHLLEGAGHAPVLSRPGEVAARLAAFREALA